MSEGTDGTLGQRETARAAFSGHRAMEAGWPTISTDGAMRRLEMGADRLLCDDGRTLPWGPTAGKTQRDRWVEGWAATGQLAGSHMRQEYDVSTLPNSSSQSKTIESNMARVL